MLLSCIVLHAGPSAGRIETPGTLGAIATNTGNVLLGASLKLIFAQHILPMSHSP